MTIEEMWIRLTAHQPFADQRGYGPEWAKMCAERTPDAAQEAAWAASDAAAWALVARAEEAARAAWAQEAARAAARAAWAQAAAIKWIEKAEELK